MERVQMSERELRRGEVLSRIARGEIRVGNAAELMGVSYRQGKRLWKRYALSPETRPSSKLGSLA